MTTDAPPILCLPGLGADGELFRPQLDVFDRAVVPGWDITGAVRTVEELAERQLGSMLASEMWREGVTLVGFSFEGQVALSMAARALATGAPAARGVVLLSAPRTPAQLTNTFLWRVAVSQLVPPTALRWGARSVAGRFAAINGLTAAQTRELKRMAKRLRAHEFKRLASVAARWSFTPDDERALLDAGVRLAHVHATRDPVIPPPPQGAPGVRLIDERAHLLTWTHQEQVREAIEGVVG